MKIAVTEVQDYATGFITHADGTKEPIALPKAEVVKLLLSNGSWIAIRPSGTEPKCKFYVEAVAEKKEGLYDQVLALSKALRKGLGVK